MSAWRVAVLVTVTLVSIFIVSATGEESRCVSCSYVLSGDPSVDRECVTAPYSSKTGTNITCNFATSMCHVTMEYLSADHQTVRSLARGCVLKSASSIVNRPRGCSTDGPYPACFVTCDSDLCNDQDGDLYKSNTGAGRGNGIGYLSFAALLMGLSLRAM